MDGEGLRGQRAGIDKHVDKNKQPDQKDDRTAPVRSNMTIETKGGHRRLLRSRRAARGAVEHRMSEQAFPDHA
jgi:hypothetical protein